jgi:hypothetical protein
MVRTVFQQRISGIRGIEGLKLPFVCGTFCARSRRCNGAIGSKRFDRLKSILDKKPRVLKILKGVFRQPSRCGG